MMVPGMKRAADVVVAGAGLIGVSTALSLAERGLKVVLCDPRPPLSLTSVRSTECYRDLWDSSIMSRFMSHSIDLLEKRCHSHPGAFSMTPRGYVWLIKESVLRDAVFARFSEQFISAGQPVNHISSVASSLSAQPFGLAARGLDLYSNGPSASARFPFISPNVSGALHARRCGWIDAQQFGVHLLTLARARGVELLNGSVISVDTTGGRVNSVDVSMSTSALVQTVGTSAFVNAAGPYAGAVGRLVGDALPLHNEFHAKAILHDAHGIIPADCPMMIGSDELTLPWTLEEQASLREDSLEHLTLPLASGVHFRPAGRHLIMLWDFVHANVPVPEVLSSPVAAASTEAPIDEWISQQLKDMYPELILRGLSQYIPELARYIGQRCPIDAGLYTRTRENLPLIGPSASGVRGAWVCAGFSGYGVMAAAGAGELLAAQLASSQGGAQQHGSLPSQTLPDYHRAFWPARYADQAYVADMEAQLARPGPVGGQL